MPSRATRRVLLANLLVPLVGYVVWDLVEARALTREIAAIAARGQATTVSAIPTGGDTPERHLAARVYAAAAEHVRALPPEVTFRLPRVDVDSVAAPAVNLEELERTYRPDAPALQLLDQAAPLDFNGFGEVGLEHEQGLVTLANLAALRADLLTVRGHGDTAAGALIAHVRVWRTVSIPSRSQVSTRLLASLRILLRHTRPSEPALTALQNQLAALPDGDALVTDLQHRRALFLDEIAAPPTRLTDAVARRALRPYIARSNRRQLDTFEEALAIAAQPWPGKLTAGRDIEARFAEAFRTMGSGFFARLTPIPGIGFAGLGLAPAGRDLAARRVIVATLAVERYRRANRGALPASLTSLVPAYLAAVPIDPFSGHPIAYRTTAAGYRVYSVDTDVADDGGALYGIGSRSQRVPQQRAPRDLGIEVMASP